MDAAFWIKLALSFVVGSLWVTLTTLSAEKFGSQVGGLIGGLPSTVVIALFFIGYTQSPSIASQATTVMPIAQGLNGLVVLGFMLAARSGLWLAITAALAVWLIQASILFYVNIQALWVSILGWLALLVFCYIVLEHWWKVPSIGKLSTSHPALQLVWRAVFGGGVITLAVLMSRVGGALLGGIFSSFPAMFLSTLVITYQAAGVAFSHSVGKSLLISGLVNVPLYEIAVRFLYPHIGLIPGTIVAILFSLGTGYLTFRYIRARLS